MTDTQKSSTMSPELARIAELAKEDKQRKFFSIAHLLTWQSLLSAFLSLRTEASAGVDGVTYKDYDANAEESLWTLHGKLKSGKYRAQPLKRIYIPKEDGRQRPISIPSLEDKIVQRATVKLLNAIYEQLHRRPLNDLVLQRRNRDGSLPSILFRYVDPLQRLRAVFAALQFSMQGPKAFLRIRVIILIRNAVHSRARFCPQTEKCT